MPSRRKVYFCRCAHEQNLHLHGFGACRCGCTEFRLRGRGHVLRILEELEPALPRNARPPLLRVQCPECGDIYDTRNFRRDVVIRRSCRRCADGNRLVRKLTRKKPRAVLGDMPKPQAFADRPHGTRLRYLAGCRCAECRAANSEYARMRQKLSRAGQGNPMVDASRVRAHLERLSAKGIGRHTVADVAGVAATVLSEVRTGKKRRVRLETQRRVLAVTADAYSEGHRIDAATTWKQIAWLLRQGFTQTELARRLGSKAKTPALQVRRDKVNARTAHKVARLYKEHHG